MENQDNSRLAYIIVCCFMSVGFLICGFIEGSMGFCLILALICGVIALILAQPLIDQRKAEHRKIQAERAKIQREKEALQAQEDLWASGNWEFPVDEFYDRCKENSINNLNDSFYIKKAYALAADILEEKKVPQKHHHLYISTENVKKHYSRGKKNAEEKEAKARQEKERKMREPQRARITEEESTEIRCTSFLINKHGVNKRIAMFTQEISSINNIINTLSAKIQKRNEDKKRAHDAALQLGVALVDASQTSTRDWGFAAGLANGIAGPGAGAAVAMDIMQENARIEQRNQQNKTYYSNMAANWLASISTDSTYSTYDLEKEKEAFEKQLEQVKKEKQQNLHKVVLDDVTSDSLKTHVHAKQVYIKQRASKVLEIGIDITNTYIPKVPAGVEIVADGTLTAEVFSGNIYVGTAQAALPLYGVPCGQSTRITALCTHYLEGDPQYRVEFKFNDLWAMEQ